MNNEYVSVGAIIEKERQARQERISKALGTQIAENVDETLEKAQLDELNQTIEKGELLPEVAEYKKDLESQKISKAEAEIYLNKIQREIAAGGGFTSKKLKQLKDVTVGYIAGIEEE